MTTEMDFADLSLIEIPVTVGDKKYILREASEDSACKYRNAMLRCTKLGPEGKPASVHGIADVEPLLVSMCLFEALPDGSGFKNSCTRVETVRSWPSRIVKQLFEKTKEISDLDEEDEDKESLEKQKKEVEEKLAKLEEDNAAKNMPESTEDTSS